MASFTVNTLLCYEKNLKSRIVQLKELAEQSTKKTSWLDTQSNIKELDSKIVKLSKALLDIDVAIKASNAKTKVEIPDFDYNVLMSPL